MTYQPIPTETLGNQTQVPSADRALNVLMQEVLEELKAINFTLQQGDGIRIMDGAGCANTARVTSSRELVTGPLRYDETEFKELAEDDTAYNFYKPSPKEQFVITSVLGYADKQVSAVTNATVIIYEADAPDTTTVDKVLLQFELGQNQLLPLTPLNILVNTAKYINAKTDDDDVHMTIMGYFISTARGV